MPREGGAPQGGAALMRRTSVLGLWPKTLAQGQFICPEHFNSPGIHKNSHTFRCGYFYGGPERDRTVDLSDANRTLSQLSYRPVPNYYNRKKQFVKRKMEKMKKESKGEKFKIQLKKS